MASYTLDEMMRALCKACIASAERRALAAHEPEDGAPLCYRSVSTSTYVMVHWSSHSNYPWRVTHLDRDGFSSHTEHTSYADAVAQLALYPVPVDPAELAAIMDSDRFLRGGKAA